MTEISWPSVAHLPFSFLLTRLEPAPRSLSQSLLPAIAAARLLQGPGYTASMSMLVDILNTIVTEPWQQQNEAVLTHILASSLSCATDAALSGQPTSADTQLVTQAGNVAGCLRAVAADPSSLFPMVASLLQHPNRPAYLSFARLFQCNMTWQESLQESAARAAGSLPTFDHARQFQKAVLDIVIKTGSVSNYDSLEEVLSPVLGATYAWQSSSPFWDAYKIWQQAASSSLPEAAVAVGVRMLGPLLGSSPASTTAALLQAMQSDADAAWDGLPEQLSGTGISNLLDDFLGSSTSAAWIAATMLSGAPNADPRSGLLAVCDAVSCISTQHLSTSLIAKALTAPLALLGDHTSRLSKAITKAVCHPVHGIHRTLAQSHSILTALAKAGSAQAMFKEFCSVLNIVHEALIAEAKNLNPATVGGVLQQYPSLLSQLQAAPIALQEQLTAAMCAAAAAAQASDLPATLQQLGQIVIAVTGVKLTPQISAIASACRSAQEATMTSVAALKQGCNLAAELAGARQAQTWQDMQAAISQYFAPAYGQSAYQQGRQCASAWKACQFLATISSADTVQHHGALNQCLELLMTLLRNTMDLGNLRAAIRQVSLALPVADSSMLSCLPLPVVLVLKDVAVSFVSILGHLPSTGCVCKHALMLNAYASSMRVAVVPFIRTVGMLLCDLSI